MSSRIDKFFKLAPNIKSLSKRYINDNRDFIGDKYYNLLLKLNSLMKLNMPISHLSGAKNLKKNGDCLGISRVIRAGFSLWPDLFFTYLAKQAALFTFEREKITFNKFFNKVFGLSSSEYRCGVNNREEHEKYIKKIWTIIGVEVLKQNTIFPKTNAQAMRMDSDVWQLYWMKGSSLQSGKFNFSSIKSNDYKTAFKLYLKNSRWSYKASFRSENIVNFGVRAFNYLTEIAKVLKPAYVTSSDARTLLFYLTNDAQSFKRQKLKSASIRSHFKLLRSMWNYFIENPFDTPKGQPFIVRNPFEMVSFKNESDRYEGTEAIPDEVVNQITLHLKEIDDDFRRVFEISIHTGLRSQDTILLEKGCVSYDEKSKIYILTYINHKSSAARLKKGLSEYCHISVWDPVVVEAIKDQEKSTINLRKQSKLNLIFLRKNNHSTKINVVSDHGYTMAIRRIIDVNNICDFSGKRWIFKSHQCRKTLCVNMIENDTPIHDLQIHIDHQNPRTTEKYYAEYRQIKIAQMNTKFFQKEFETDVGKEHLKSFTEKERLQLYEDFCLGKREVEFGQCTKHAKDGKCGKRTGHTTCAICPHICTGKKYENKWAKCVVSAKKEIAEYKKAYASAGITRDEYKDFREYQKVQKNLEHFQAGLSRARKKMIL